MKSCLYPTLAALLATLLAAPLHAQQPPQVTIRGGVVVIENAQEEEEEEDEPEDGEQEDEEKAASPGEELAKALSNMKFDRSPKAVLEATRQQRSADDLKPEQAFQLAFLFGDWKAVGETLATLPEKEARDIYRKMISALGDQSVAVGDVLRNPDSNIGEEQPYERANRLQNEERRLKEKSAPLLTEDFYGIVEAAPGDLGEDEIGSLAKIVSLAVGEGGRATLVDRLKDGIKGIGGDTPDGRRHATALLSQLEWITDAAPFLPLDPEQWEEADTTALIHTMEYFTQSGIKNRDERLLQRAAEVCARLMKGARFGNYTRPQFRLAMERLVRLLPVLEPEAAKTLIREQLFPQSDTLGDLVSIIAQLGQEAMEGSDLPARAAALGTQNLLLEALVALEEPLPSNVGVLILNWLVEAEGCYRAGGVVATERSQAERMMMRRYGFGREMEVTTLSTEQILATAPPAELIPRLNPGLAQRVRLTLLKVRVLLPEEPNLELLREYLAEHPGLEREICHDVLAGWVSKRTKPSESEQVKQMRAYGMYIPPQMLQAAAGGIPLTRLRQNQNITHFKNLLAELREISPDPLDPSLIVQAFMTLHSGAEVYQLDDIIAIFGPPEDMVPDELLELLDGMRGRLAEQWRDPSTQQQGRTNRTEEETKDEVSRGYRTAIELVRRGILPETAGWKAFITRGQVFFDASQYEFDRQVTLTDYVNLRDEGFASLRKAAELYAAEVSDLPRGQWSIAPYQAWFFVMLGASDLAQLTTQTARTDPGLAAIGDAIRALPGEAAEAHLEMFAHMLGEVFPRVPPNVRQRFLSSGLSVVGEDHPAAAAATRSLDYYRELLDEIQLRLTIDGPTRVGHGRPFGVFIGLETTRQLLRESGGFGKYLANQATQQQAMMGGSPQGSRNLRDDFAKNIQTALEETFEVVSVTFHDAAAKPLDLPREGWVETPFAYLVLRAKDAAVDRIPSIQIDMDFVDQPGQVVLPVMSQVQSIDAADATVPARPIDNLELKLTLDDREWKDGQLTLDIQATGRGIIPDLDELFDIQRPGFDHEVIDSNLSITRFVSDGGTRHPEADRNWQITYRLNEDPRGGLSFPFPALRDGVEPAAIEFAHYRDADLVTIEPDRAAAGIPLAATARHTARNLIFGAIALLALGLVVWLVRRRQPAAPAGPELLAPPADPTPFASVAFLRRLQRERAAHLGPAGLADLATRIREIEAAYFGTTTPTDLDLAAINRQWFDRASQSRAA